MMEESISWGVYFLYFLFSIAFSSIIYALFFSKGPSNLPPGSYGLPIIGETIHFGISGPDKFISERMKKHSTEVFRTSLLGEKMAVFCGSAGHKFVFNYESNLLSHWYPPSIIKILGLTEQEHLNTKTFKDKFSTPQFMPQTFLGCLKGESVKQFIPIFNEIARNHVKAGWKDHAEVKVYPLSKLFSFNIACRFLMGISDEDVIKSLSSLYYEAKAGISSMPINLPGTTYYRALRASKTVQKMVSKIIQERIKDIQENNKGGGLDVLSQVLQAAPNDTIQESTFEVHMRSLILGILLAAASPVTPITFTLKYLTELPHVYDRVYQEQMEIAKSKGEEEYLSWNDLNKMEYTWNVVSEVLRFMPIGSLGGFREVKSSFTYAGYTIPKGWKILWTYQTSHKDPKYFENPEEFNPSRFENSIPPYAYVAFGGGRLRCPAKEFSKLSILTFLHIIVTKFKLEKLDPNEGIKYLMSPIPENGFPVRLIPL